MPGLDSLEVLVMHAVTLIVQNATFHKLMQRIFPGYELFDQPAIKKM